MGWYGSSAGPHERLLTGTRFLRHWRLKLPGGDRPLSLYSRHPDPHREEQQREATVGGADIEA